MSGHAVEFFPFPNMDANQQPEAHCSIDIIFVEMLYNWPCNNTSEDEDKQEIILDTLLVHIMAVEMWRISTNSAIFSTADYFNRHNLIRHFISRL